MEFDPSNKWPHGFEELRERKRNWLVQKSPQRKSASNTAKTLSGNGVERVVKKLKNYTRNSGVLKIKSSLKKPVKSGVKMKRNKRNDSKTKLAAFTKRVGLNAYGYIVTKTARTANRMATVRLLKRVEALERNWNNPWLEEGQLSEYIRHVVRDELASKPKRKRK